MRKQKIYLDTNIIMDALQERVSLSLYRDNLIIKGGFLIATMVGVDRRGAKTDTTYNKGRAKKKGAE